MSHSLVIKFCWFFFQVDLKKCFIYSQIEQYSSLTQIPKLPRSTKIKSHFILSGNKNAKRKIRSTCYRR